MFSGERYRASAALRSRRLASSRLSASASLFRTAKYRPQFPAKGFDDLEAARQWASRFVRWYNHDPLHSGIRYVSPAQRHAGEGDAISGRAASGEAMLAIVHKAASGLTAVDLYYRAP